ncbi:MAG: alpha-glucuronidase [Bacteroidales bacterium]|nr:alpha-glucuronidase [Bacteroidales bacterium]
MKQMNRILLSILALIAVGCSNGNDELWLNCGVPAPQGEPYFEYRILDHWDNLDNTVECGYAGESIWNWTGDLPKERIERYCRLNKSIGINGVVLNNVNADPSILTEEYLYRVSNIARILERYDMDVFLAVNFASPMALGDLDTADPLDIRVCDWWKAKVDRIYELVPNFGGFLVKASSEGLPGPQDFGRTQAQGANMIARLMATRAGIVMWRTSVTSPESPDMASQDVEEFMPLDGTFRENVIVQVKNGPVGFQPREPINPLFFNLKKTDMMPELQITQEYLGQSWHLTYLGTMWEEFFACMFGTGQISNCRRAIAGVANTGQDASWCGHIFSQANWYAFGRLAWDPTLDPGQIAEEWLRGTFRKPWWCSGKRFTREFIRPVKDMMMRSREACVDYEMPLGTHMLCNGSHYGPGPWEGATRPDCAPAYCHKAAADGIGFDRTEATGTGNTAQYPEPLRSQYENIGTCPEDLLLWFHHVPWDYRMSSGRSLWDELCLHYDRGVSEVQDFLKIWEGARPYVDRERWNAVQERLTVQEADARRWRDACIQYFGTFSGMPVPEDVREPEIPLDSLMRRNSPRSAD